MKRLIYIIFIVVIFIFGSVLSTKNKSEKIIKNDTALNFKYFDNARLYKVDFKNNKFYLIHDFRKKRIV